MNLKRWENTDRIAIIPQLVKTISTGIYTEKEEMLTR